MINLRRAIGKIIPQDFKPAIKRTLFRLGEKGFRPYVRAMEANGIKFDFWIGDHIAKSWYEGRWYSKELRYIRDHLIKPGDIVFDCGAHHGCMAILFSHWVEEKGKVIAFESLPRNADVIENNIKLNKLQNVVLERKAVGSKRGKIAITDESDSQVIHRHGYGIEVEMTCLDEYSYLDPSFLKIDVEGYEIEVLKGAQHILKKKPKLAIEIHTESLERYNSSIEELFRLIDVEKYELWVQWHDDEEPVLYDEKKSIRKRVHLYGLPHS